MHIDAFEYEQYLSEVVLQQQKLPREDFVVAIEGPNGCGKSTVVKKLIQRYEVPYQLGVPDCFLNNGMKYRMIAEANWQSSCLYFLSGVADKIRELKSNAHPLAIIERSLWSTLAAHSSEDPSRLSFIVSILNSLDADIFEPTHTIILRASFEHCRKRIAYKDDIEEVKLDELVNSKEYYTRENMFYDWLSASRKNVFNINVTDCESTNVCEKVTKIIDGLMASENTYK